MPRKNKGKKYVLTPVWKKSPTKFGLLGPILLNGMKSINKNEILGGFSRVNLYKWQFLHFLRKKS